MLVHREMAGDQGQDAAGLECVERLGDEEIVERQLHAAIIESDVGEGWVADHRVEAALGQLGVAKALDPDILAGMQSTGDSTRD